MERAKGDVAITRGLDLKPLLQRSLQSSFSELIASAQRDVSPLSLKAVFTAFTICYR
jgi:hypothetical protein